MQRYIYIYTYVYAYEYSTAHNAVNTGEIVISRSIILGCSLPTSFRITKSCEIWPFVPDPICARDHLVRVLGLGPRGPGLGPNFDPGPLGQGPVWNRVHLGKALFNPNISADPLGHGPMWNRVHLGQALFPPNGGVEYTI